MKNLENGSVTNVVVYLISVGSSRPTCASMDSYHLVRYCVMLGSEMLNDDEVAKNS